MESEESSGRKNRKSPIAKISSAVQRNPVVTANSEDSDHDNLDDKTVKRKTTHTSPSPKSYLISTVSNTNPKLGYTRWGYLQSLLSYKLEA